MNAAFVELVPFERRRPEYLDDEGFRQLQNELLEDPHAGDVIARTGGLRKLRRPDPRRRKGKRGGLRVIYYWWQEGAQFWLVTIYDKDEQDDISERDRSIMRGLVESLKNESESKS